MSTPQKSKPPEILENRNTIYPAILVGISYEVPLFSAAWYQCLIT